MRFYREMPTEYVRAAYLVASGLILLMVLEASGTFWNFLTGWAVLILTGFVIVYASLGVAYLLWRYQSDRRGDAA